MLNGIFVCIVLVSILLAAYTGRMHTLTDAILRDSREAVELALRLVGVMAFFLGLMKVAEDAGLMRTIARLAAPVMRRLFPTVPAEHPAMSAMIMNIASNMLGLGNAATPFGIRAMEQLDTLNGRKGTATGPMVLFLAINTSGFAILPASTIALRAAAGSADATGIFLPTWFASGCATIAGIVAAIALARLPRYRATEPPVPPAPSPSAAEGLVERGPRAPVLRRLVVWAAALVFAGLMVRGVVDAWAESSGFELVRGVMSHWTLPGLVAGLVAFGWSRSVPVYESLVEGAKEGFQVALRIIPYLVAILVAVGMFRASGGMAILERWLGPLTSRIGLPVEALPMAVLRPLSGSGAQGLMTAAMKTHGPDSLIGYMVSTFQGSTETTFYVLAVYFGAVGVKRTRHALPACLIADAVGILAAVAIVNLLYG